jgi:hypothetical protein
MTANPGTYWKRKFRDKLKPLMYSVRLYRYSYEPTHCPGGWGNDRDEFDVEADVAYHIDNPTATVCRNGLLGDIEILDIKGFYFSSMTSSQLKMLAIDTLDVNEGVFVIDGYINMDWPVVIEYPADTFHSVIFCRDLVLADVAIARYAKLKKTEYTP